MRLKDQPENDEPTWKRLHESLSKIYSGEVKILFPHKLEKKHIDWFMEIERQAFRTDLRYSESEIKDRLKEPGHLLMFVLVDSQLEATLLAYTLPKTFVKTLHLDTIAVKTQRKGVGRLIIEALIEWAKMENVIVISVDTEVEDEKVIHLQRFYESLGFNLVAREESGNLTMKLVL